MGGLHGRGRVNSAATSGDRHCLVVHVGVVLQLQLIEQGMNLVAAEDARVEPVDPRSVLTSRN